MRDLLASNNNRACAGDAAQRSASLHRDRFSFGICRYAAKAFLAAIFQDQRNRVSQILSGLGPYEIADHIGAGGCGRAMTGPGMHRTSMLMHMRTTLNIDDSLLGRATQLSGLREKTAVVRAGLEALVARESAKRLAALGGSEKAVRPISRRRVQARRKTA